MAERPKAKPNAVAAEPAIAVQRAYDLALWLVSKVEKFPRSFRFKAFTNASGEMEWDEVAQCLNAWNSHASHGDTWRLREQIFSQHAFVKDREG